jgi:uncharacterized SAM-binding protein YcdF (DUF218 family)
VTWLVLTTISLFALWPLSALALVRLGGRAPAAHVRFDVIVVLGCHVLPDGTASRALAERTALAAALWHAGHAPKVVLSGGAVSGPIAEARAALAVLVAAGVPEHAVILEDGARSTVENATRTHALVGDVRALVVTHDYHAPRARLLFRRVMRVVETAGAPSEGSVRAALREVLAFVLTALRVA